MAERKIEILVTDEGLTCNTDMSPFELVFYLESAKKMVFDDHLAPEKISNDI